MSDPLILRAELDATAATALLHAAETEAKRLGLPAPQTGTRALGPFSVNWDVHGSLREHSGEFVLKGPEAFGIQGCMLDYSLEGTFSVDLNAFKPPLSSLPDLPTVPISLKFSHTLPISGKVALHPHKETEGMDWLIDVRIVDPFNIPVQIPPVFFEHMGQVVTEALQKLPALNDLVESFTKAILQSVSAEHVREVFHPLLSPLANGLTLYRLPSFVTLSAALLTPVQLQAQIDVQITDLSVTPRLDDEVLTLTWTGMVIPKLVELGLSLQLSGENLMHVRLPEPGLDEHILERAK
jgi:hypothetical protein